MDFLRRTWAEIDLNALKNNFDIIRKKAGNTKIAAVVKADAYGHGAKIIAPVLETLGADAFAVSNIEEAVELRSCKITKPILILGYTPTDHCDALIENDISQCVYSLDYAKELSKAACGLGKTLKIHLKLDSGMGRIGFDCRNDSLSGLDDAYAAASLPCFNCEGIFTHFAVSDRTPDSEDGFTNEQYVRFIKAVGILKSKGLNPKVVHCSNSAAICRDFDKKLDMVRPGIILYGLSPEPKLKNIGDFIPVMTLKSTVSMVKEINEGETVSYGRTFTADRKMRLATVAIGYADGYPRQLSNKGSVLINGKRAKITGRICMDQMLVDVSDIEDVHIGTEVTLFGKELSVNELAELVGTINYEILCGISKRVIRTVV